MLNTLRPRQRAALEKIVGDDAFVLDRNVLILDIFARHARTAEGKLQVELAQLRHRAPISSERATRSRAWAAASARAGPERRNSKSTGGASGCASRISRATSNRCASGGANSAARERTRRWWRWWATRTPASPRCSTR